jgi:hypothetical protein
MSQTSTIDLMIPIKFVHDGINLEKHYKEKIPGVQVRFHGLGYKEFPHKKRSPYISMFMDGQGYCLGASLTFNY